MAGANNIKRSPARHHQMVRAHLQLRLDEVARLEHVWEALALSRQQPWSWLAWPVGQQAQCVLTAPLVVAWALLVRLVAVVLGTQGYPDR